MNIKNSRPNITVYKMYETKEYDSYAIMYEDAIDNGKSDLADCLIAKIDTKFSVSNGIPTLILLIENKLVPVRFTTVNRQLIVKLYGSTLAFFKQFDELFKTTGIVKSKPKLVPGSIGIYNLTNIAVDGFDFTINGTLIQHYRVNRIDESIYRGTAFKFIRDIKSNSTRGLDDIFRMSEEEFSKIFEENRLNEFNAEKDIAILVPILPDNKVNNRKRKKANLKILSNPRLPRMLNKYEWCSVNSSVNTALSTAYCEWYHKQKEYNK